MIRFKWLLNNVCGINVTFYATIVSRICVSLKIQLHKASFCGEYADCTNSIGSYTCECPAGFSGNPDKEYVRIKMLFNKALSPSLSLLLDKTSKNHIFSVVYKTLDY